MPTTGAVMCWGAEPKYPASPKAVTAPLLSVNQYPPGSEAAIPTKGWVRAWPPSDPKYPASPKAKTPPSAPSIQ